MTGSDPGDDVTVGGGVAAAAPTAREGGLPRALAGLRFDNRFTRELPADPEADNRVRVVTAAYSRVVPATAPDPRLIAHSVEVAASLGIEDGIWDDPATAGVLSGSLLLPGSDPHAANYGGHQFGNWAGQLGDGRAIGLGEVVGADGCHHTLQLKGAGPTPYSRGADGFAVLRSSIREFLCSEAMHHLGVPTTRALSLVTTGRQVVRDLLYDGNPAPEPGAVVCRVAPSFVRFGTFQLPAARGDASLLRALADHTIRHHFPHLEGAADPGPDTYAAWFDEVCRSTCDLVVDWMRVGFVHGVLNTDNMSIHGLTIDYGPYGWIDDFDLDWTPNTTDASHRRYRFGHQPRVVHWNLAQLANAVLPLVGAAEPLESSIREFAGRFTEAHRAMMLEKLGLSAGDTQEDDGLIADLFEALSVTEIDMTIFYRQLAELPASDGDGDERDGHGRDLLDREHLGAALYDPASLESAATGTLGRWLGRYRRRVERQGIDPGRRRDAMNRVNPRYVLRNYLAQEAIDAAEAGDPGPVHDLLDVLRRPYDEQPGRERYAARRPDWARSRPGCSMLSCSS